MIDKELKVKIESVRENGGSDECFNLSCELSRRAEGLLWLIWRGPVRYSNWEQRVARREMVHGVPLHSETHANYLARHKWAKYKRQFLNYKSMVELLAASEEMMQLGQSRLEGLK